jgi:nucleotide-binding universal stress UspA family protein
MFKKILLPSDGSANSLEAARFAADLALTHGGEVTPIIAVEFEFVQGEDIPEEVTRVLIERIRERTARALQKTSETVRDSGARCAPGKVVEAPPVDAILQEAEDGEFDVIVMGSRGVSLEQGRDRVIGSVTEQVLHKTPCPVLVIRTNAYPK